MLTLVPCDCRIKVLSYFGWWTLCICDGTSCILEHKLVTRKPNIGRIPFSNTDSGNKEFHLETRISDTSNLKFAIFTRLALILNGFNFETKITDTENLKLAISTNSLVVTIKFHFETQIRETKMLTFTKSTVLTNQFRSENPESQRPSAANGFHFKTHDNITTSLIMAPLIQPTHFNETTPSW